MARVTRADVAKLAGVSPATVSVVLNGNFDRVRISKQTQMRVREAARELRYFPSAAGRILRNQTTPTIAFLLGALPADPYVPVVDLQIITAMQEARRQGFFIIPITADDDNPVTLVESLLSQIALGGVVCETTSQLKDLGETITENDIPVMWMSLLDTPRYHSGCGHITIREHPGIKQLVAGLDLPSDTPVLSVWGPVSDTNRLEPASQHFHAGWEELHLDSWSSLDARDAIGQYLQRHDAPRIIWCADDLLTAGALYACNAHGLRVPEDVQIIGYGDQTTEAARASTVTAAHWPVRELTVRAVDGLIDAIQHKGKKDRLELDIPTTAVWRSTTRPRLQ